MLKKQQINMAIEKLKNNEIIILPTDTVYGFSAISSDKNAAKINSLKKAPLDKPLIVLVSNLEQLEGIIDLDKNLLEIFDCKEPTTVITKLKNSNKTIAFRLITRVDLKEIIDSVGPIFSTSVNFHGEKIITDKNKIKKIFSVDFFNSDDECLDKKPSRIYVYTSNKWIR